MNKDKKGRIDWYHHEDTKGCMLETAPFLLVDAWAARYTAAKQRVVRDDATSNTGASVEVYVISHAHTEYRAAARDAYLIRHLLTSDAFHSSGYVSSRARLADAGYSELQLQSVPCPQETIYLHMMTNGVFTCVGKIHKARKPEDSQQWYYCTDCSWVYPGTPGTISRTDLTDEGIVLIPIDATFLVPFADPSQAVFWTRRVLLQQGFLVTLTSAAQRLAMHREAVQSLCRLGVFHRYDHPNIPAKYVLYTLEIEIYRNEQRRTRQKGEHSI
jgi:hypothetical protein